MLVFYANKKITNGLVFALVNQNPCSYYPLKLLLIALGPVIIAVMRNHRNYAQIFSRQLI